MTRRRLLLLLGLAAVAAGTAAGLAVALTRDSGPPPPTKAQYLARASAVCHAYAVQLERVPPPDLGSTVGVVAGVSRALPLLERQARAVRAVQPPEELRPQVERYFILGGRSLALLRGALAAARRGDQKTMGAKLGDWIEASDAAREASHRIGFRC